MLRGGPIGAALTSRPIVGDAWRRCCADAAVAYLTTSADVDDLVAGVGRPNETTLLVLVDHPMGTVKNLASLHRADATVLLLSPTVLSAGTRSSLAAGVDAVITIGDPLTHIRVALQNLLVNESYASPAAVRLVLAEHRVQSPRRAAPLEVALSKREREVLQSMVEGLTTKATARRLGIAVKTVEAHRGRIFTRLQVHTQAEAVTRAITDPGLLSRL